MLINIQTRLMTFKLSTMSDQLTISYLDFFLVPTILVVT